VLPEGQDAEAAKGVVVLLDTEITPELEQEATSREVIRAIQELRKTSGFSVEDRILVQYKTDDTNINQAIEAHKEMIMTEVLATSMVTTDITGDIQSSELPMVFAVNKV